MRGLQLILQRRRILSSDRLIGAAWSKGSSAAAGISSSAAGGGGDGRADAEVVIVGAGIAGVATALALGRVGAEGVVVLERAPGLRSTGAALTLAPNAWRALAALGVAHKLIPLYPSFDKLKITNIITGATQEASFAEAVGRDGMRVRSVHRKILLESLAAELPPGTVRFSTKITSISTQSTEEPSHGVVLHMDHGTAIRAKGGWCQVPSSNIVQVAANSETFYF